MALFHSTILGAIQGITEFLPISSSAHLVIVPYLFGWPYSGLGFDVALHLGTVIAILAYFWRDWMNIIANAVKPKIKNPKPKSFELKANEANEASEANKAMSYPKNLLWQILVATIPAAIVGYFIQKYVESIFHSPLIIAVNLATFGVILWLVDKYAGKSNKLKLISYNQSFLVGLAQSFALIPGVSRSGITMVASRAIRLDRESSARFSFLLGTPAMIGAFIFEAKDFTLATFNLSFIFGLLASTIFGFLAIKYLLQYLKRGSFAVFTWYRIILAAIVIAVYFLRI